MKIEQNICHMKMWYNNSSTSDAVIVLYEFDRWRTVKIFDPMWIMNMTKSDIEALFMDKLLYRPEDCDMAKQYSDMVEFCYAYDIHVGSDWKSKWKDLGFEVSKRR